MLDLKYIINFLETPLGVILKESKHEGILETLQHYSPQLHQDQHEDSNEGQANESISTIVPILLGGDQLSTVMVRHMQADRVKSRNSVECIK